MLYNNRVTICTCASRSFIDKEKVVKVAAFLRQEGYDVVVEPDLCEKVRERTSDLPDVASSTIIACYPRRSVPFSLPWEWKLLVYWISGMRVWKRFWILSDSHMRLVP